MISDEIKENYRQLNEQGMPWSVLATQIQGDDEMVGWLRSQGEGEKSAKPVKRSKQAKDEA